MKLTLMIEGSPAVIAAVLDCLPEGAMVSDRPSMSTGIGTPGAPALAPSVPSTDAAIPPVGFQPTMQPPIALPDDDDEGAPNTAAPDVDANGLPWDERIHASTKAVNNDGSWKKRRGVAAATVTAVEAELRARGVVQQPAVIIPPQPIALPPTIPMQPAPLAVAPAPIAPIPAPAPVPAAAPTAMPSAAQLQENVTAATAAGAPGAPTVDPQGLAEFMTRLNVLFSQRDETGAPLVHADYLSQLTAELSNAFVQAGQLAAPLNNITEMGDNQNMINYAVALLKRDGKWR